MEESRLLEQPGGLDGADGVNVFARDLHVRGSFQIRQVDHVRQSAPHERIGRVLRCREDHHADWRSTAFRSTR